VSIARTSLERVARTPVLDAVPMGTVEAPGAILAESAPETSKDWRYAIAAADLRQKKSAEAALEAVLGCPVFQAAHLGADLLANALPDWQKYAVKGVSACIGGARPALSLWHGLTMSDQERDLANDPNKVPVALVDLGNTAMSLGKAAIDATAPVDPATGKPITPDWVGTRKPISLLLKLQKGDLKGDPVEPIYMKAQFSASKSGFGTFDRAYRIFEGASLLETALKVPDPGAERARLGLTVDHVAIAEAFARDAE